MPLNSYNTNPQPITSKQYFKILFLINIALILGLVAFASFSFYIARTLEHNQDSDDLRGTSRNSI